MSHRGRSPGKLVPTLGITALSNTADHKRTFKQKLHDQILDAEAAELQAVRQHQLQDRKSLAVALLAQGRAQAYLDFFHISRPSGTSSSSSSGGATSNGSGAPSTSGRDNETDLQLESLVLLQQQLMRADAAAAAGQPTEAYDAYRQLGLHFKQLGHKERAQAFFEKCLRVACGSSWREGELEASCALGLVCEELQQQERAAACHERCLQLAQELARPTEVKEAYAQLVHVYAQQAEQQQAIGQLEAAAERYRMCLEAARNCGDAASAGAASHHLGLIHQQSQQWDQAMECHREFLETSRALGDKVAEGAACCAYAECQQQLGDLPAAVQLLEEYLELSHAQDPRSQAVVCCKLGILQQQLGQPQLAVRYLERCYELARSIGEPRLLDAARVNLGLARAEALLPQYTSMALSDLGALLRYKNTRQLS